MSADYLAGHVTGESIFIDDRPQLTEEVLVGYVGSPVASGRLLAIDPQDALKIPGVIAVYTHKDFFHNQWGTITHDQPLLVADQIGYQDEPISVVAAENRHALEKARKAIRFEIDESQATHPPILSIDEAIEKESYLYQTIPISRGHIKNALTRSAHQISGVLEIGGQEHFYLESQASIAYPLEEGQLEIHSSSQHPTEVQHVCAEALGLKHSQVVCVVKRMGGAFGGKESQAAPFAAFAALVATKLKRSARMVLDKDDDMRVTGKRHPFKVFYEAGFENDGRLNALKVRLYADGGAYTDLSPSVINRAVFHCDGAYYLENVFLEGFVCKTNTHSNTAFRGFGAPQGNMVIENIMEEIALHLKKDAYEVRKVNCYGASSRNTTHYGQRVENNLLPDLFERLHRTSDYSIRRQQIKDFNSSRSGRLRGLSMTACKFGLAFNARFLNQASAQVSIHRDGTVQVSTGATEMGQGVNAKIRLIVADAFCIPEKDVQVMATSTEKNHNTSPTAASSGTDLNGAAALVACDRIKTRLKWAAHCHFSKLSLHSEFPAFDSEIDLASIHFDHHKIIDDRSGQSIEWRKLVNLAYLNRISLGDYGFYRTEGLDFDPSTQMGRAFKYFTSGVAVSEVEIDEYTGALKLLRTDILMDLGRPLHPAIDRGQVLGGFIQGVGWLTTERLYYDSQGRLLSHSPTTYKIPSIQDIPRTLNVDFIENDGNTKNIYRSKAAGEPPLLLGTSVWMAVKDALSHRVGDVSHLRAPATPEEILMRLPQ